MTLAVMTTVTCLLISVQCCCSNRSRVLHRPSDRRLFTSKVTKTVERPVVETKVEQREQTVFRPQTVTETTPAVANRLHSGSRVQVGTESHRPLEPISSTDRCLPSCPPSPLGSSQRGGSTQPTHAPSGSQEKRTIDVPQRIVRMQREQKVDYEVVGRVSPQQGESTRASRARSRRVFAPWTPTHRSNPLGQTDRYAGSTFTPGRVSASTVGRLTSDPPRRTAGQGGMRAQELSPVASGLRGQALPPVSNGVGVANMRALPFFR